MRNASAKPLGCLMLAMLGVSGVSVAARADESKSGYHLFNPTPREKMRAFETDRPDRTESPYTVDAGHFQVETDLLFYQHDGSEDAGVETTRRSLSVFVPNLKAGLTHSMDLQLVLGGYASARSQSAGDETHDSGYGDTTLRLKANLLGNDGGPVALGLMPFVKLPTASQGLGNGRVEGGLIFPVAVELPSNWGLGMMFELDKARNEANDGYHTEFVSSLTVGHSLLGPVDAYLEFFSAATHEEGAGWVATADLGLVYAVTDSLSLDANLWIGLTEDAPDLTPSVGFSTRF